MSCCHGQTSCQRRCCTGGSAAGNGGLSTLPFFPDLPAWSGGGRTVWLALPAFLWETTGTEESGSCGCCRN